METFASFSVGGQKLYGMVHLPNTPKPETGYPSVLMLHGFTGTRYEPHRLFVLLSRYLMTLGIASMRFDFRGSGESEGDFSEMTVSRELQDTAAAYAYLQNLPEINPHNVSLLGLSMGGMLAALSAAKLQPRSVVLWNAATPEDFVNIIPHGFMLPTIMDYGGNPVGKAFIQELPRLNPVESLSLYSGKKLVIQAEKDPTVPLATGEHYAKQGKAELHVIPEANHTFDNLAHIEKLYHITATWLLHHA